jgi:acyl transferase domain-containing protein
MLCSLLTTPTEELQKDVATTLINEAHISQPACTAIQLALTDLLQAWGIFPAAVAGHSSGEIGAAYAAGIWASSHAWRFHITGACPLSN